jgi:hypothetical protein
MNIDYFLKTITVGQELLSSPSSSPLKAGAIERTQTSENSGNTSRYLDYLFRKD